MITNNWRQRAVCILLVELFLLPFFAAAQSNVTSEVSMRNTSAECRKVKLVERAKEGHVRSILDLGICGNRSNLLVLKARLEEARRKKEHPTVVRALRKAAAKLGDKELRRKILSELDSDDLYTQHHAFEVACYVEGTDMIVGVAQKLSDERPGGRPMDRNESGVLEPVLDVSIPAPRHAAVIALSQLIEDPSAPKIDVKRITYSEDDVAKWRKWWNKNKEKYLSQ